jgi:hypothetical protein
MRPSVLILEEHKGDLLNFNFGLFVLNMNGGEDCHQRKYSRHSQPSVLCVNIRILFVSELTWKM